MRDDFFQPLHKFLCCLHRLGITVIVDKTQQIVFQPIRFSRKQHRFGIPDVLFFVLNGIHVLIRVKIRPKLVKGSRQTVNLLRGRYFFFIPVYIRHRLLLSFGFRSGRQLDLVIHILFAGIRQHHHSIIEYAFFLAEQTFHLDTPIL